MYLRNYAPAFEVIGINKLKEATSKHMGNNMRYSLLTSLMLLLSGVACAADKSLNGDDKCFLWEIESKTATVYMMGSFHMFKREMYPLNDCYNNTFEIADTLVVEVDMNAVDENQMAKLFETRGLYQGDVTIDQRLSKDTLVLLKSKYGTYAVPGNHEYIGGIKASVEYLESHNITVLRDRFVKINNSFYNFGFISVSFNN